MVVYLRRGLPPAPALERLAYLQSHASQWRWAWILWIATALVLVLFYLTLHRALQAGPVGLGAVLCALAGLVPDIAAEAAYITKFPSMAGPWELAPRDRAASLLSGCLGNGLYTIAWALLAWQAWRRPDVPRGLALFAMPGIAAGFGLAVAGAMNSPIGMTVTSAAAIPLFTVWAFLAGLFFWKNSRPADRMAAHAGP